MDEYTKKKILKILYDAKKENPKNPVVTTLDLEKELNIEFKTLESYIRDLKYRGYITYDGPETFEEQDIQITPKGEKLV
jgi:Mn-dependent DtxR family transcriptional regulator